MRMAFHVFQYSVVLRSTATLLFQDEPIISPFRPSRWLAVRFLESDRGVALREGQDRSPFSWKADRQLMTKKTIFNLGAGVISSHFSTLRDGIARPSYLRQPSMALLRIACKGLKRMGPLVWRGRVICFPSEAQRLGPPSVSPTAIRSQFEKFSFKLIIERGWREEEEEAERNFD